MPVTVRNILAETNLCHGEAHMSHSTQPRAILLGILVSVSESSPKKRTRAAKAPPGEAPVLRRIPWCGVLVVASAAWTFSLVLVALLWGRSESRAAQGPLQFIQAAPVVAPAALPGGDVFMPAVLEVEEDVPPLPPGPAPLDGKLVQLRPRGEALPEVAVEPEEPAGPRPAVCAANLGTRIEFIKDPPEAFKLARREKKLVFMIHLSGNFEEKEFT